MRIALAGNPNSGKTTMFNALTGGSEKVGNWAGVTVEKKEDKIKRSYLKGEEAVIAVDLPGTYSMSAFTSEEGVTSSYIKNEDIDVIINIVDATNLSRSLFFTTQLLELGIPMILALNKADVNKKKQTVIDAEKLSQLLNCPVVETVSTTNDGLAEVVGLALEQAGKEQIAHYAQENIDYTDKFAIAEADKQRFSFVNSVVRAVETRKVRTNQRTIHDKIDVVLTNKWLGIPIFAVLMFLVFQISQAWLGAWLADGIGSFKGLVGYIEEFKALAAEWMSGAAPILQALVLEGIIQGVAAVVGFLPLVMVMYFLIALLEDCGYMSRVSVVLDPIFKKVGLSGKSVVPFIIGTGCAVPAVMACRTIRDERERRATALITPFMPCGAKLPVISLFVGAFFPKSAWVGTAMYFFGILIILFCAWLINKITCYKARKSFFIIELPEYKAPSIWNAVKSMCARGKSYVVKAGTIILVCNFIIYLMQNFNLKLQLVDNANESMLAAFAAPVAYVLAPIVGVVAWQFAAAALTGFIAKECVVGTLATCYAFERVIGEELEVIGSASVIADNMGISAVAALAFLMFNLFSPPCFAAIGAMNAELGSKKWLIGGVALQLSVGYAVGFLTYVIGCIVTGESFGTPWMMVLGFALLALMVAFVAIIIYKNNRKLKAKTA